MASIYTSIYVTIGNSDDRLTQAEWADYRASVDIAIREHVERVGGTIYGAWVSPSAEPFQNACWSFALPAEAVRMHLRVTLRLLAARFRQHSIAWAEAEPEFLPGIKADD